MPGGSPKDRQTRLFADYGLNQDTMESKWVDSHLGTGTIGWAGHGRNTEYLTEYLMVHRGRDLEN